MLFCELKIYPIYNAKNNLMNIIYWYFLNWVSMQIQNTQNKFSVFTLDVSMQ